MPATFCRRACEAHLGNSMKLRGARQGMALLAVRAPIRIGTPGRPRELRGARAGNGGGIGLFSLASQLAPECLGDDLRLVRLERYRADIQLAHIVSHANVD